MIAKVEMLTNAQLEHIRQIVGEAFVTNELFHNWGTEEERRNDVLKYMGIYVDYVYRAGELYANENMTGFIGLEDSYHKPVWPQIRMIFKMLVKIRLSKVKSLLAFAKQISVSNERYAKQRHFEALMVCHMGEKSWGNAPEKRKTVDER